MKYITFKDDLSIDGIIHYVNVKAINHIIAHQHNNTLVIITNEDKYHVTLNNTTPDEALIEIFVSSPEEETTIVEIK